MISEIPFINNNQKLSNFYWKNIPPFAVIAGENGSGKTALLEFIYQFNTNSHGNAIHITSPIAQRIFYFPVGQLPTKLDSTKIDLNQWNTNILTYFKIGNYNNPQLNIIIDSALKNLNPSNASLITLTDQEVANISDSELLDSLPVDLALVIQQYNNNNFIASVFSNFEEKVSQFKVKHYGEMPALSYHEICKKLGSEPPWEMINNLFEKYKFNYRISKPIPNTIYKPTFCEDRASENIDYSALSSGEKIIVTLILWAFNSRHKLHTEIFLLDEIDAHLNPTLAKMMIDIVSDKLVSEFDLQVIMTTHSPSTIAYCPDEALFWMTRKAPIESSTKRKIIPILSDGIITVQSDSILEIISPAIDATNKPILFVEGKTDVMILKTAWEKLRGNIEIPFHIQSAFDCYFLTNMFKRAEIFKNYPDQIFMGLIDFDRAFDDLEEKLNKKLWPKTVDNEFNSVSFTHKIKNHFISTLPVPKFRKRYASPTISGSQLSIELLFDDSVIEEYCKDTEVLGGSNLLKFKDSKKATFSEDIIKLDVKKFIEFESIFAIFEKYLDNLSNSD